MNNKSPLHQGESSSNKINAKKINRYFRVGISVYEFNRI